MPKVSVIIPVYKVERYIERCAYSIFEQTLDDIEYIFIDDCTPDKSIEVIERILVRYPQRKHQTKILRHSKNLGVGRARLDGMQIASGEYIIHCDPDDWVEPEMYEILYNKAVSDNADMVCCGYYEEYGDGRSVKIQLCSLGWLDFISDIFKGKIHGFLWNKLVRNHVCKMTDLSDLPLLSLWEDVYVVTMLMQNIGRISCVDNSLYHYRKNVCGSIVTALDSKKIESQIRCVEIITKVIERSRYAKSLKQPLYYLQLRAKGELLANPNTYNKYLWLNTFKESNNSILGLKASNLRKFIMYMASKRIFVFADAANWVRKYRLAR